MPVEWTETTYVRSQQGRAGAKPAAVDNGRGCKTCCKHLYYMWWQRAPANATYETGRVFVCDSSLAKVSGHVLQRFN